MPVTIVRHEPPRIAGFPTNKTIERRLSKMLDFVGRSAAHVSVLLTGDEEIRTLNRRYRKKTNPQTYFRSVFPQPDSRW